METQNHMKKLSLILSLCIISSTVFAQFGLNLGYRINSETDWQPFVMKENFLGAAPKIGLDYWFRLKKVRVEFSPELNYSRYTDNYTSNLDDTYDFKVNVYGFHFNTNIYPLNFKDDCNCPTFKKDGQILDKGFHFILSPGVNYYNFKINDDSYITDDIVFSAGLGVGLDLGLTDYITLTPMVLYNRHFGVTWEDLDQALGYLDALPEGASTTTDIDQFFVGARLRIRFDEMNKYGYR